MFKVKIEKVYGFLKFIYWSSQQANQLHVNDDVQGFSSVYL